MIRASCAAGAPEQAERIAAHAGTATGLPNGLGLGDGLEEAVADGLGLADALALGDGDGLMRAAELEPEQPATAITAATAASLSPTGKVNADPRIDVTGAGTEITASTISPRVCDLNELWIYAMRASLGIALLVLTACFDTPVPLTADVTTSATQSASVGGRAQLVVSITNTGPSITHLGLTFRSADKWYERHTVTDPGGCTIDTDHSAFDCGNLAAGAAATFSITGTANQAGTFHYELALRELVQPFAYVNDHPDGADVQTWDETIASA